MALPLARPPAFLLPLFVAVEAVDMVDMTDVVLVSILSSKSGMLETSGLSDCAEVIDCVDNREDCDALETLDVLALLVLAFDVRDFEALPFLDFDLLLGAVVPAQLKNGHSGALRWCSSKGLSFGSQPSRPNLHQLQDVKSSHSSVGAKCQPASTILSVLQVHPLLVS